MYALYALIVKAWTIHFCWGHLYFGSIVNFTIIVGRELRFGWAIVVKSEKDSFNIYFDIESACAVILLGGIIPFEVKACKFVSFPIL